MRPIVFLHLPKTAGQSVRVFLNRSFPKRLMFPGQVDSHLALYSKSDLKQFSIFSGHFSWALLDCLGDDALFFTILRDPAARIISFYRHLRRHAEALSEDQLALPSNQGLRAALTNPMEDWLNPSDPGLRAFTLSHIDNYYTYYFATRVMNGRGLVRDNHPEGDYFTTEQVLNVAIRNLRERVKVFATERLTELTGSLSSEEGFVERDLPWINRGSDDPEADPPDSDFLEAMSENPNRARELLFMRTEFDRKLYQVVT